MTIVDFEQHLTEHLESILVLHFVLRQMLPILTPTLKLQMIRKVQEALLTLSEELELLSQQTIDPFT